MRVVRRKSRAFSLVEMLAVIGIVILLAGLLLAVVLRPLKNRACLEAGVTLDGMVIALQKLKEDYAWEAPLARGENGALDAAYLNTNEFVKELAPQFGPWAGTHQPRLNARKTCYFELKQHQFKDACAVDPWGRPYRYNVALVSNANGEFEVETLSSDGPDQQAGTSDDLVRVVQRYPVPASQVAQSK